MESIQKHEEVVYPKTADEFMHLYEQMYLPHPMDFVGKYQRGPIQMNHYRFFYYEDYVDCHASTENQFIEIGKRRVAEMLPYSEENFKAALHICQYETEHAFTAKVLCYPDYDTKTIYFDIWAQSLTPQELDQLNYMLDSALLLVDILTDEVTKLIMSHKEGRWIF